MVSRKGGRSSACAGGAPRGSSTPSRSPRGRAAKAAKASATAGIRSICTELESEQAAQTGERPLRSLAWSRPQRSSEPAKSLRVSPWHPVDDLHDLKMGIGGAS